MIGVSFQQIQKYEKGMSQLSATRLRQIAIVLRAPTSYFLGENRDQCADNSEFLRFATIPDATRLLRAAHRLSHSARAELVKLAESWANDIDEPARASIIAPHN
jgi:transcriptional regulator with XRE-family HTH domain